jgi:hypothetical protein
MSLREVTITGKNNVKAKVTGQEELLVRVNSSEILDVSIIGDGVARTANILRPTGPGTVTGIIYSISVANVGTLNGSVLGGSNNIKPGEVLSFSADAVNNYFTSFDYNASGTEFIIIYVS